jgi:hypothetical protein
MKTREPRRKVLVGARIRHGLKWDDIRILNVSSRGLCLHSRDAPPRGIYVKLRRGCAALPLAMTVAEAFTRPMKAISIALASSAQ